MANSQYTVIAVPVLPMDYPQMQPLSLAPAPAPAPALSSGALTWGTAACVATLQVRTDLLCMPLQCARGVPVLSS